MDIEYPYKLQYYNKKVVWNFPVYPVILSITDIEYPFIWRKEIYKNMSNINHYVKYPITWNKNRYLDKMS